MEETVSVDVRAEPRNAPTQRRRGVPWTTLLSFVVGLVGVSALGASAWVYQQTQRDMVRLSTDIAQLRVSLELYSRQQGNAPASTDNTAIQELSNRLGILEESWRAAPAAASAGTTVPSLPATAPAPAAASAGDCLPTGTRFLVSAGDSYPICGIAGNVQIGAVDNGFISLADGTVIAAGGNIGLPGTACMIGVVSAGEDGMTGFAEIRVTC